MQCRSSQDVFCFICGEYMMVKYRFNVKDFTKRDYEAYFGIKLGTKTSLKQLYRNTALLDPRQSQFDAVWGFHGMTGAQKSP